MTGKLDIPVDFLPLEDRSLRVLYELYDDEAIVWSIHVDLKMIWEIWPKIKELVFEQLWASSCWERFCQFL